MPIVCVFVLMLLMTLLMMLMMGFSFNNVANAITKNIIKINIS